jgi:hypothetical protein
MAVMYILILLDASRAESFFVVDLNNAGLSLAVSMP